MIDVRLLGPFEVEIDGNVLDLGTPKQVVLAAALAARAPAVVSRDRLMDDLWDDAPPASAGSTFAGYLSNLRRAIEPGRQRGAEPSIVVTRRPGYALDVEPEAIDLHRFRTLVARADSEPGEAGIALLDQALSLVRGPALDDARGGESLAAIAHQIDEEVLVARESRLARLVDAGRARPEELEGLIAEHPYRERLRVLHARALYHDGRQAEALRSIATARSTMLDELGLDVGPELQDLEQAIFEHSPTLSPAALTGRASSPALPPRAQPSRSSRVDSDPIFGRDREMAAVHEALDEVQAGRTTVLLIAGDSGTGKSHLALQLAEEAVRRGLVVGSGHYSEAEGRPPLSAWNDARRMIVDRLGDRLFEIVPSELLEAGLSFVGGDFHGDFSHTSVSRPEDLHRLIDVMRASARHMSEHERLVLVLEDFHHADSLSFTAIESWGLAVEDLAAVLALTYRPEDLLADASRARWLRSLAGAPRTVRLELGGIDAESVGALAHLCGVTDMTAPQIEALARRTGGNPLFVSELCRVAVESGTPVHSASLPEEIVAVVAARLDSLAARDADVVRIASLADSAIGPDVIASVLDADPDEVDDRMLACVDAGLLMHDRASPGAYRFANALVREVVANSIGPRRRARQHAAIGHALLSQPEATELDSVMAGARHLCLGARAGTAQDGAALALTAGRRSIESFGHSTAHSILTLGIDALAFAPESDMRLHLDLLRWRGLAAQALGLSREAREDLLSAFRLAVEIEDAISAAEIALATREGVGLLRARSWWNPGPAAIAMLDEAIATLRSQPAIDAEQPGLLPDLLSARAADGVAGNSLDGDDFAQLVDVAEEAVDLARATAPEFVPSALTRRALVQWLTRSPADLLPLIEAGVSAAVEHGDMETEMFARTLWCAANLELGELEAVEHGIQSGLERAERAGFSSWHNALLGMPTVLLTATGQAEAAERMALRRLERVRSVGPLLTDHLKLSIVATRLVSGHADAALDADLWLPGAVDRRPSLAAIAAMAHAEAGRADEARQHIDRFDHRAHVRAETSIYSGVGWAAALAARALLGDLDEVSDLYERISVMAGRLVVPGPGSFFLLPADYFLGIGATALGRQGEATSHFETATAWAERVGSKQTLQRIDRAV